MPFLGIGGTSSLSPRLTADRLVSSAWPHSPLARSRTQHRRKTNMGQYLARPDSPVLPSRGRCTHRRRGTLAGRPTRRPPTPGNRRRPPATTGTAIAGTTAEGMATAGGGGMTPESPTPAAATGRTHQLAPTPLCSRSATTTSASADRSRHPTPTTSAPRSRRSEPTRTDVEASPARGHRSPTPTSHHGPPRASSR